MPKKKKPAVDLSDEEFLTEDFDPGVVTNTVTAQVEEEVIPEVSTEEIPEQPAPGVIPFSELQINDRVELIVSGTVGGISPTQLALRLANGVRIFFPEDDAVVKLLERPVRRIS